jgi:hypothetical protein
MTQGINSLAGEWTGARITRGTRGTTRYGDKELWRGNM